MKWMSSISFCSILLFTLWVSAIRAEPLSKQLRDTYNGQEFVEARHADFSEYELILGKLTYQYPSALGEQEGFRPMVSRSVEGQVDHTVYDLPTSVGPLSVFGMLTRSLRNQGYDIAFTCERIDCGSVKGWGVFFPHQKDGSVSDQYVVSAVYPEAGPVERVFSAHMATVGDQVRVSMDEVTLLVDTERAIQNYADAVLSYWSEAGADTRISVSGYEVGSDALTQPMKIKLKAIARVVTKGPNLPINLVGYTDGLGEEAFNDELSLRRAKNAAVFLKQIGSPEMSLGYEGAGVFRNPNGHRSRNAEPQHRKVVIVAGPETQVSRLN